MVETCTHLYLSKLNNEIIPESILDFISENETVISNFITDDAILTFTDKKIIADFSNKLSVNSSNVLIIPFKSINFLKIKKNRIDSNGTQVNLNFSGLYSLDLTFPPEYDPAEICDKISDFH